MLIGNSAAGGAPGNLRPGNSESPPNDGAGSASGADSASGSPAGAGVGGATHAPADQNGASNGQDSSYAGGRGYDGPTRADGYSASVTTESRSAVGMVDYSLRASNIDADREAAMKMHATARIMALVATVRQVDDVSAYALFDRASDDTDAYRHAAAAYSENSE
ncbi:MAG: hypothetical protein JJ864_16005 [Rhizobiaceae bacterium]|nr:hypothetical protein [Rhizobiaceae bacterium]